MASTLAKPAIEATGLTKKFGSFSALRGIDLAVEAGDFLTIFGPNGAGKSTLIRILATIGKPTGGRVSVHGLDCSRDGEGVRQLVGLVPHQTLLYDDLTVYENLLFYGRMYRVPEVRERIEALGKAVGLESRLHDRARGLSRGLQQRASIARALIHDPAVLLLDEPETGLDREALALFESLLRTGRARTVIMTTHRLEQGYSLAKRVIVLVRGRVACDARTSGLGETEFIETYCRLTGGPR